MGRHHSPLLNRKMLLTSSQASILLSSGIVLLFTTALFLSGCVIQQRTLRELRAAIKPTPRPSPKIYLPDRFKQSTTELADGTVVIVGDVEPVVRVQKEREREVVEVEMTELEPELRVEEEKGEEEAPQVEEEKTDSAEDVKAQAIQVVEEEDALTERERNVKSLMAENMKHPDPTVQDQTLMSRAERRRLIKQELRRLAEVKGSGYQRRVW